MTTATHELIALVFCGGLLLSVGIIFYRRFRPAAPGLSADRIQADIDEDDDGGDAPGSRTAVDPARPIEPGFDENDERERYLSIRNVFIGCYVWFYLLVFGVLTGIGLLVYQAITGRSVSMEVFAALLPVLVAAILYGLIRRKLPYQTPNFAPRERELTAITTTYAALSGVGYYFSKDPTLLFFIVGINAFLVYMLLVFFVSRSVLSGRLRTESLLPAVAPALEALWLLSRQL